MYPAYNQGYYEEADYSNKDEFQYNSSSGMKAGHYPTPPVHDYQQSFDKPSHGYAAGNTHNLDKFSHGAGGYASQDHSFDKTGHGFGGHDQNLDKFSHRGYGGYEQNGYDAQNFDKMSHGQPNFDKGSHGYPGNGHNFDKMSHGPQNFDKVTHGYAGNGHNFDKMSHGQPNNKTSLGSFAAGFNLSFDKFKQGGGHNAPQHQASHFESGNDFYGNGGNQHGSPGYGNKFGSGKPHNYDQSGGYAVHHGSPMHMGGQHGSPMPMGGHRPIAPVKKGATPTWNFKGISDF